MADDQQLAEHARWWLVMRRRRSRYFSHELFDEFAWDMLLHLFAAGAEGRALSDERLIAETTGRTPSGLRWMAHLEERGEIARGVGPDGEVAVSLTDASRDRMRAFLTEVGEGADSPATAGP